MTSWRAPLLDLFPAGAPPVVTVLSDRDRLFAEAALVEALAARGYALIPFDDRVAGRLVLERDFREPRDAGRPPPARPVVWLSDPVETAPYDVLAAARRAGRVFAPSAASLFPGLSASVLPEVDRADFDALWDAAGRERPSGLGRRATADFILRHAYGIDPDLLGEPAALLEALMRLHYGGRPLPPALAEHLLERLKERGAPAGWPLDQFIDNPAAFYGFLQRHWEPFVRAAGRPSRGPGCAEAEKDVAWGAVPFGDTRVRVYLDNLFADGLMVPTAAVSLRDVAGSWLASGVVDGVTPHDYTRMDQLTHALGATVPGAGAGHRDWLAFALRFGDWLALRRRLVMEEEGSVRAARDGLYERVNAAFLEWLRCRYGALGSLSHWPQPALVHQVPAFLDQSRRAHKATGIALVVVDGMGCADWAVLRPRLGLDPARFSVTEHAVFAGIPTLTEVSRRALFAGLPPRVAAQAKGDEAALWRRFWEDRKAGRRSIVHAVQGLADTDDAFVERILEQAGDPAVTTLGVVVNTLDRLLHDAPAGWGPFDAALTRWAVDDALGRLIRGLAERGFRVVVTADHGNMQAVGIGRPPTGKLAEASGERALLFGDRALADAVAARMADGAFVDWTNSGLPMDQHVVLAAGRGAFTLAGAVKVCHGGASLEEVAVPLIEIAATSCPPFPSDSTAS